MSKQRNRTLFGIVVILVAMIAGCETAPGPFVPKARISPQVVYCNDNTGHNAGSKPWVMGGTCCCTPSDALMDQLHKDGFCQGMNADDLTARYKAAGIALKGPGHQYCNGLCDHGPHVVLGGKCMCPPTPGTEYYEKVTTGIGAAPCKATASSEPTIKEQ
jgi:hypothetical protein